jgi:tetratricopeptide (TPR) repeat protein
MLALVVSVFLSCEREPSHPTPDAAPRPEGPTAFPLVESMPLDRHLSPGAAETFSLDLAPGDYAAVVVDQQGVDVVVEARGPTGALLMEVDSPNGREGPEPVYLVADAEGRYELEVEAGAGSEGAYRITLAAQRSADEYDRQRAAAALEHFAAEKLRRRGDVDASQQAMASYLRALTHWQAAGDEVWEAVTCERLARVYQQLGRTELAIDRLEEARRRLRSRQDQARLGIDVLIFLARLRRDKGDNAAAAAAYEEGLELARRGDDQGAQASLLNNLALLRKRQGETRQALDLYQQALSLWRGLDDRRNEAIGHSNVGMLYSSLGDPERARDHLLQALELLRGDRRTEDKARTLAGLAKVERRLDRNEESLRLYREALALHRQARDRQGETDTLLGLAQTQAAMGKREEALATYLQAARVSTSSATPTVEPLPSSRSAGCASTWISPCKPWPASNGRWRKGERPTTA